MQRFQQSLRRYSRETRASEDVQERLRLRLDRDVGCSGSLQGALDVAPGIREGAAARVQARIRRSRRAAEQRWSPSFLGPAHPIKPYRRPALVLVALLSLAGSLWMAGSLEPEPVPLVQELTAGTPEEQPEALAASPAPDPTPLVATGSWKQTSVGPEVALRYLGTGSLAGSERAPRLTWLAGTIEVEVDPDRGIDLRVSTPEAQVAVVGTGFSITRDVLGTRISVTHGKVRVSCSGGEEVLLSVREARVCPPISAAGLLARARGLSRLGARPQEVLDAVDRGIDLSGGSGAIWSELMHVRIELLGRLGRRDELRAAGEAYLRSGATARRDEVLRILGYEQDLVGSQKKSSDP